MDLQDMALIANVISASCGVLGLVMGIHMFHHFKSCNLGWGCFEIRRTNTVELV